MKLLLDAHILLWALSNDKKLPEKAKELILNIDNDIYYSIISLWEVELKHLAHPDAMTVSAEEISKYCGQSGFTLIPVKKEHIFALADLKRPKEAAPHKDPFDRMLICQAASENMLFVTHDSLIPDYEEPCILPV